MDYQLNANVGDAGSISSGGREVMEMTSNHCRNLRKMTKIIRYRMNPAILTPMKF